MSDDEGEQDDALRCGGCRKRLQSAWALCERCQERLAADLLEVADRYAHLSALSGYEPGRYDKPTSVGKPGTKPPGRVDVMALRDFRSGQSEAVMWQGADGKQHREAPNDTPSILRVLVYWVDRVIEERRFEHRPDTNVDASVEFLGRQGDWLARWNEGAELAAQVRKLRNRLRSATGEPNAKPAAYCIRFLGDGVSTCKAPVWIPETAIDAASYEPVVRCAGHDRHEYTRGDLTRLALAQEPEKRQEAS